MATIGSSVEPVRMKLCVVEDEEAKSKLNEMGEVKIGYESWLTICKTGLNV